ncbi:MAG: hypothetical protein H0V84_04610 [Actinobacteria bacterium]|nr:hypothetical protein [Actinomycetota bacterium]
MTRLRPLSEAECYARCYGDRDDNVSIVRVSAEGLRRQRAAQSVSGEHLRQRFEERLETRDPAELIEPEAA